LPSSAATASARPWDRPVALARAVPVPVWLGTLVLVSAAIRFQLARGMVAPWIMVDELIYSELAKSFAASGHFLFRGHPTGTAFGFVYPVLISPAWAAFQNVPHAYAAAKAINCVVMSLAAVPAYLLARRMAGQWLSLLAATLAVAIPSLIYTGTLMTENAFYPLFLTTIWALVCYLERPGAWRVLGVLAATFFTFETRAQAIALVPAILVAPVLLSLLDRRGLRGLRDHVWLYGIVGGLVVLVAAFEEARGHSPLAVLGVYESAGQQHHATSTVARWFLYHLAEIDLYVGVIPFAALIALAAMAYRLPRQYRAFVAAVVPTCVFLLGVVAEFASRPDVARIEERNMFYLAPLFLIALVAWIDVGVPRPVLATGIAVVAAAALPGLIPFSSLINVPAVSDTLSLIPWWWLQDNWISMQTVSTVVVVCSIAAGLLFLVVPRRFALVLPALVLAYFAFEQHPIETGPHSVRQASLGSLYVGDANPKRDWIDRTVGHDANVVALWSGVTSPFTVWENEFFNRSVGQIYDLSGPLPGGQPEKFAHLDRTTGAITGDDGRSIRARYVLTDASVALAGKPLAEDSKNGLVLFRVGGPLRSQSVVSGLYLQDTWSGKTVRYTRFSCAGGRLRVLLGSDQGLFRSDQTVTAREAGRVVGRASVTPLGTTPLELPLRPAKGRCVVDFTVGRTVVPAAVTHGKNPDTRELGAHFLRFVYLPK
jgi:dolichyl-phosphate-mannose-protein mannosyltransferase